MRQMSSLAILVLHALIVVGVIVTRILNKTYQKHKR